MMMMNFFVKYIFISTDKILYLPYNVHKNGEGALMPGRSSFASFCFKSRQIISFFPSPIFFIFIFYFYFHFESKRKKNQREKKNNFEKKNKNKKYQWQEEQFFSIPK